MYQQILGFQLNLSFIIIKSFPNYALKVTLTYAILTDLNITVIICNIMVCYETVRTSIYSSVGVKMLKIIVSIIKFGISINLSSLSTINYGQKVTLRFAILTDLIVTIIINGGLIVSTINKIFKYLYQHCIGFPFKNIFDL